MPLASAVLFRGLDRETLDEAARAAVEEFHPAGAFLFHAGDPALYLYILDEGRIRLSVAQTGDLAHIIDEAGEAIGWSSVAAGGQYVSSAECLVPVRAVRIEARQLNRILERHPASGLIFFRRLAALIGQRLTESYGAMLSVHAPHEPCSYG